MKSCFLSLYFPFLPPSFFAQRERFVYDNTVLYTDSQQLLYIMKVYPRISITGKISRNATSFFQHVAHVYYYAILFVATC